MPGTGIAMNVYSAVQYLLFVVIVTACVRPLGGYMHRVFARKKLHWIDYAFQWNDGSIASRASTLQSKWMPDNT
jgi:K+-transporting ATPase A subunit